ncbi:predicted protein [Postia placenta Mad-698-R]|nr:predicted protein [Postia placenta Mad-698-R]
MFNLRASYQEQAGLSATDAAAWGVVSHISENVLEDAIELANMIAGKGTIAMQAAKEAINVAFETTLDQGLRHERTIFYGLFAMQDQEEGMLVFAEKRLPVWSHS